MELEVDMPAEIAEVLGADIQGHEAIVAKIGGFVGLAALSALVDVDRPDLKFPAYSPRFPERIREHGGDCFAAIRSEENTYELQSQMRTSYAVMCMKHQNNIN